MNCNDYLMLFFCMTHLHSSMIMVHVIHDTLNVYGSTRVYVLCMFNA